MFINCIFELNVSYQELIKYETDWYSGNKKKLLEVINNDIYQNNPTINITRWNTENIPEYITNKQLKIQVINDIYQYTQKDDSYTSWHVNFADGDLFIAYGSDLFAQDEHQVMEHPILANIKEMLLDFSKSNNIYDPNTRNYDKKPYFSTPILIKNAQRIFSIDTKPNEESNNGIYGQYFSLSSFDEIQKRTIIIKNKQFSNIIAMEAFSCSKGFYKKEQIEDMFITSYTSFKAAKQISSSKVSINTGNWGTGVYGGNKIINALIQLLAAMCAEVDEIIFHTLDTKSFNETSSLFKSFTEKDEKIDLNNIFCELVKMNFKWNHGDGN